MALGIGQSMRVDTCHSGSWSGLPAMECTHPGYGAGPIKKVIYLDFVTHHLPKRRT